MPSTTMPTKDAELIGMTFGSRDRETIDGIIAIDGVTIVSIGGKDRHRNRLCVIRCCVCDATKQMRLTQVCAGTQHSCGCLSRKEFKVYQTKRVKAMTQSKRESLFDQYEQALCARQLDKAKGSTRYKMSFAWQFIRRDLQARLRRTVDHMKSLLGNNWHFDQIAREIGVHSGWAVFRMARMAGLVTLSSERPAACASIDPIAEILGTVIIEQAEKVRRFTHNRRQFNAAMQYRLDRVFASLAA